MRVRTIFGTVLVLMLMMQGVKGQKSYLDLRLGMGIPRGDFAEMEGDSVGFATSGFLMSFEGNYFFAGGLGVVGSLTYGMNGMDEIALQDHLKKRMQELYPGITLPPDATQQWNAEQWNNVNLLAGPVLSFPISSLKLELRGMLGVSFVMPPQWEYYVAWEDKQFHVTSSGQSARFAWQLGGGLTYMHEAGYGFRLGFDYFSTTTRHNVYYTYRQGNADESPYKEIPQFMQVAMYQATVGILYAF